MYLYLLLRKPGNDHRLVTTFDLISAQRPTSYYHLWQRILRRSPNAGQLCGKDSLAFTHSMFFCGEAMLEVRVCKRKRCLRNFCRRVVVVRPHTYPTQRLQCCHHVGQSQWLKSRHLKSHLSCDDAPYTLVGESHQLSLNQLGCHQCKDNQAVLCFHTKRTADRTFSTAKCLLLTAVKISLSLIMCLLRGLQYGQPLASWRKVSTT